MKKVNPRSGLSTKSKITTSTKNVIPIPDVKGKFEVLPSPVKSFSDKKEYKVIRLENGLTACLISDLAKPVDVEALLSKDTHEEEWETESESGSDEEIAKSETSEDEDIVKIRKPANEEVKLAAAALCVGVGSFSDPKKVPGLAHFLEHMVFMGSEKFQKENDFDAFIKKNGGSDNASTDYEVTTFYFECFEKHLCQAMDKFAQFFISPLMKRESMAREREAIESEFQMAVPSDDFRKEQLLVSLAKGSSPVNSFSWGNLITLRDNISDNKLYEKLHEFRKRHYSAHRMTVAVQARLPMEILESYVVNCFSSVPNNALPPDDFKQFTCDVLDTPKFKRLYYVKPIKDICQVDLTWIMPSLQHMYKSKPHAYVSWLLGHEGRGSLLSYLKQKVWALSLYAGNDESGAEFNSIYASFSVNIILTKEGFTHLQDVIGTVFSYLEMLKNIGPNERIFKEIQQIEETTFRFDEDETAADTVEDLAEFMQYYPPEDYLTGSELFFEYKPEAITMVLDRLAPEKMNIMVLSSDLPEGVAYDKTEPWFKTQYTDQDIPPEWLKSWLEATPLPNFALPEPNPFLTEDFSLLTVEDNIPEYPQKILETPVIELWYRKDQKFQLPMSYYRYYLITPLSMESATSFCMMQMFVVFVKMNLSEEGYPAQIADLSYSIMACEKGICLKVTGYNEKLPVLIKLIVKYLKTVSDNLTLEVFEAIKEKQTKDFYNAFLKPSKLCKDLRLYILQKKYFSLIEKHAAVSEITLEMMKNFSENILKNLYIQGLVQGNVTSKIALETTLSLLKELNCEELDSNRYPMIMVKQIPQGEHCCRVLSFNKDNSNSIITNYYQCDLLTIKENVILEFILLLIEEPSFDTLRTKEQLGYSVSCTIYDTYGVLGYGITVNAQADKHTTEHVDNRIEAFLKHSQKIFKKLTDKKFNQMKQDLIKMKQFVDVDLEDEVSRNWEEIVNLRYVFDRLSQEIQAIQELKIKDVRTWWDEHKMYSKKNCFRKLSMQVVGHVEETSDNNDKKDLKVTVDFKPESEDYKLENVLHLTAVAVTGNLCNIEQNRVQYLVVEPGNIDKFQREETASCKTQIGQPSFKLKMVEDKEEMRKQNKNEGYFITDINDFRKKLNTFPESAKTHL